MKQVPIPVLFVSFEQNLIHLPQGWEIGIYRRKKGSKQESNHALDHKKEEEKKQVKKLENTHSSTKKELDQENKHLTKKVSTKKTCSRKNDNK